MSCKKQLIAALIACVGVCSSFAQSAAERYPSKPVKIVVGAPPGGVSDTIARALAAGLAKRWTQPVVIENRPGASWLIATGVVAAAPADGHTLLFTYSTPLSVLPFMYRKALPYDFDRDMTGVAVMGELNAGYVVRADSPYRTLKDLVEVARSRPGDISVGNAGVGQTYTLASVMFANQVGVEMKDVPFAGMAPIGQALLSSSIDSALMDLGTIQPFVQSGKFRLLAVIGAKRQAAFPGVPTFAEAGYPDFKVPPVWFGLVAQKAIPSAVRQSINHAVTEEVNSAAMHSLYAQQSINPLTSTPEQMNLMVKEDVATWGTLAKKMGVMLD